MLLIAGHAASTWIITKSGAGGGAALWRLDEVRKLTAKKAKFDAYQKYAHS
jgi:hypothetical protein